MDLLENTFHIRERNSTVGRELLGGVTTFMTLSYIIFVQPAMMHTAGVPFAGAFIATCVASAIACVLMALTANYPIALAPAMGHNAYFTYVVVLGLGLSWQQGLTAVFIGGCIFLLLSFFGFRSKIMEFIPQSLKRAIAGGIGLLITLIGLEYAGLVVGSTATGVKFGHVGSPVVLLALFGLALTLVAHGARACRGPYSSASWARRSPASSPRYPARSFSTSSSPATRASTRPARCLPSTSAASSAPRAPSPSS